MMKKTLFLLVLFAISLLSFASAEQIFIQYPSYNIEGFHLSSSGSDITMCGCSTGSDMFQAVNTGSVPVKLYLSSNLDYVSFAKDTIDILPGDSKIVHYYIHAPCEDTTQTLEIYAKSIYGEKQVFSRDLNLKNCDNLVIYPSVDKETSVCTPFQDNFTIFNTGSFTENYEVKVKTFEKYSSVSKKTVTIPSGKSYTYLVDYDLPCDINGEHDLVYDVTALKNSRKAEFSTDVNITPDYDFKVLAPASISVCDSDSNTFNITLENQNHFKDEFLFNVDAPSFVDLVLPKAFLGFKSNVLVLEPDTFNNILLNVNPNGEKHAGEYNISIAVTSLTGDVTEEVVIPFTVSHCYDFTNILSIPYKSLDVCADDNFYQDIVLENKGVSPVPVQLNISSPNFVSLTKSLILFDGYEGKQSSIYFNNIPDVSQTSNVVVDAYFMGDKVGSDSFELNVHNRTSCYGTYAPKDSFDVRYDADKLYVTVKNYGFKDGYYTPKALNLPDYLSLESSTYGLESSDKITLTFNIDKDVLAFNALSNNNGSIVGLSDSFLLINQRTTGQEFYSQIDYTFVKKPFFVWAWDGISNWWSNKTLCTQAFIAFFALSAIFALLIIIKLILGHSFRSSKLIGLIILIVLIIAVIVIFSWKGIPSKSDYYTTYDLDSNSTIYLTLAEDEKSVFDLNNFFFDPDGEVVDYNVDFNNSFLKVKIKSDKLKIKPVKDWNGLTSIIINATDNDSATTSSGNIFVEVLPVEDYTCKSLFKVACSYFSLVMLIIAGILFYVLISLRKLSFKHTEDEKQLTLMETVVVRKKSAKKKAAKKSLAKKIPKNKSAKKSTSKKKPTKKTTSKNSTTKSTKKSSKKKVTKKSSKKK